MKYKIILSVFLFLLIGIIKPQSKFLTDKQFEYLEIADSLLQLKQYDQNLVFVKKAYKENPYVYHISGYLGNAYLWTDSLDQAEFYLWNEIRNNNADYGVYYDYACLQIRLGKIDSGLVYLEESFKRGVFNYEWLGKDEDMDPVRNNKRYIDLMHKYFSKNDIKAIEIYYKTFDYIENGKYKKAIKNFKKAIKIENKTPIVSKALLCEVNWSMAKIYRDDLNEPSKAIECYKSYIEHSSSFPDRKIFTAHAYNNIGYIYGDFKEYNKEIESYKKSLQIRYELENEYSIMIENRLIGLVYYSDMLDKAKAKKYFLESLKYSKILKNNLYELRNNHSLKKLYFSEGQYDNALQSSFDALTIASELDSTYEQANILNFISGIYLEFNENSLASIYSDSALSVIKSNMDMNKPNVDDLLLMAQIFFQDLSSVVNEYNEETLEYFLDEKNIENWKVLKNNRHIIINDIEDIEFEDLNISLEKLLIFPDLLFFIAQLGSKAENEDLSDEKFLNKLLEQYKKMGIDVTKERLIRIMNEGGIEELILIAIGMDYESIEQSDYRSKNVTTITSVVDCEKPIFLIIQSELLLGREKHYKAKQLLDIAAEIQQQCDDINGDLRVLWGYSSYFNSIKDITNQIAILKKIVTLVNNVRIKTPKEYQSQFFELNMGAYNELTNIYLEKYSQEKKYNYADSLIITLESARSRAIIERLQNRKDIIINQSLLEDIQNQMNNDQTIIYFFSLQLRNFGPLRYKNNDIDSPMYFQLVIKKDSIDLNPILGFFRESMHIDKAIKLYLFYLKNRMPQGSLLSRELYDQLLYPIENQLNSQKEVIIIPDRYFAVLPFGSLIDSKGNYLCETFNIKYVQSLTVLYELLKNKNNQFEADMLAIGDIDYQKFSIDDKQSIIDIDVEILRESAINKINASQSLKDVYDYMGYNKWTNLPGSKKEINGISELITDNLTLMGTDATETNIKNLSKDGALKKYRFIHFSTHGLYESNIPELSALILAKTEEDDGFLRMGEIANLDINADLVNLSACETGLGRIFSGDGVVGLTQSFIQAGASGVCASLWPIADEGTSDFMLSVYSKITKGEDYSESINNTKREFISGLYGKKYKHPYYWAPFVYYGK